jgi:hypothetical protein
VKPDTATTQASLTAGARLDKALKEHQSTASSSRNRNGVPVPADPAGKKTLDQWLQEESEEESETESETDSEGETDSEEEESGSEEESDEDEDDDYDDVSEEETDSENEAVHKESRQLLG